MPMLAMGGQNRRADEDMPDAPPSVLSVKRQLSDRSKLANEDYPKRDALPNAGAWVAERVVINAMEAFGDVLRNCRRNLVIEKGRPVRAARYQHNIKTDRQKTGHEYLTLVVDLTAHDDAEDNDGLYELKLRVLTPKYMTTDQYGRPKEAGGKDFFQGATHLDHVKLHIDIPCFRRIMREHPGEVGEMLRARRRNSDENLADLVLEMQVLEGGYSVPNLVRSRIRTWVSSFLKNYT